MKLLLVVLATVACACADVSHVVGKSGEAVAEVVRSTSDVKPDGYNYSYQTSNNIAAQAEGVLKKIEDSEAVVSQGQFQYVSPDGTPILTSYVADEHGFQPQGAHLPTPPPVPEYILRAIEYTVQKLKEAPRQ